MSYINMKRCYLWFMKYLKIKYLKINNRYNKFSKMIHLSKKNKLII